MSPAPRPAPGSPADAQLLERAPHLELIRIVLAQAQSGSGQLLWVEGAAGAGKTSLVRAASDTAKAQGMIVLRATAEELESDHLLGVVHQLFDPFLRTMAPDQLDRLFAGPAGGARASLLEPTTAPAWEAPEEEMGAQLRTGSLLHGLYWLVARLSEQAPLLLTIDDLHWIDPTSLSFVSYLARRLEDLPVAVVLGTRTGVANSTETQRARIRAQEDAHHVSPPALTFEAVATLVRTQRPDATDMQCRAVLEASAGNPFLVEVAAQMTSGASGRLHDEVRRRLAALAPEVQQVAKALSVMGVQRSAGSVAAVASMELTAALDATMALLTGEWIEVEDRDERGLGRQVTADSSLRFRHPLVRDAVVQLCSPSELDLLHARAIDVLAAQHADPAEIAVHALASVPRGCATSVTALVAAADRARRSGAVTESLRLLDRALLEPPPEQDLPRVLAFAARASAAANAPDAAARFAAAITAEPSRPARMRLRMRLATALLGTQRSGAAAALIEDALAEDDGTDLALHAELLSTRLVALRMDPGRRREWEENLDDLRALDLDALADVDARAPSLRAARAELSYRDGVMGQDYARAHRLAMEAVGDEHAHELAIANGQAFSTAMHALLQLGELELVLDVTDRARGAAQAGGYGSVFRLASTYHGLALVRMGRARDAVATAVVDEVMERHLTVLVPINLVVAAQGFEQLGRLDDAERVLDPPEGLDRFRNELTYGGIPERRGWLRLIQDRPADALQSFLELAGGESSLGGANPSTNSWRSGAARALFRIGDKREAQRISDTELDLARRWGAWRQLGIALNTAALVRTGSEAAALFDEAVAVLEPHPDPFTLGWTYLNRGYHRRAGRSRREARDDFRRALDLGHRHEFALLADAANDALVDAGGRPRTRVLSGVDALTPAELRVARAVATGLTNADVAANLFITRKAVEYHLSNVYRKLDIRGRADLAQALSGLPEGATP